MFLKSMIFFMVQGVLLVSSNPAWADSPLAPVKTESPRATMKTFYEAMNLYREGVEEANEEKMQAIDRAVRTLDLQDVPPLLRKESGREAAIFLKEVIDRILTIRYDLIPTDTDPDIPSRWRLKDTDIVIMKLTKGDREGQYLFSAETVANARDFFEKVRSMPYVQGSGMGAGYREPWLQAHVPSSLKHEVFGLLGWQWGGILGAIVLGWVVRFFMVQIFKMGKFIITRAGRGIGYDIATVIEKPVGLAMASGFWFFCLHLLKLEGLGEKVFTLLNQAVFSFAIVWMFYRLVDVMMNSMQKLSSRTEFLIDPQFVPFLGRTLRILVAIFGTLIALQNLGVNVMSVIAGLGIGGLAFALAAKDTAANLFGTIMIFSDRPFKVGDWIKFGDIEGNVEHVGFRSTRIRTFYNSQISVPNAVLANVSIDNLGRREVRRIRTLLKLSYETTPDLLENFMDGIRKIIRDNAWSRKDDILVTLSDYGDTALVVLVQFFLKVENSAKENEERQNIFMQILKLAKTLGVEFSQGQSPVLIEKASSKKV